MLKTNQVINNRFKIDSLIYKVSDDINIFRIIDLKDNSIKTLRSITKESK